MNFRLCIGRRVQYLAVHERERTLLHFRNRLDAEATESCGQITPKPIHYAAFNDRPRV